MPASTVDFLRLGVHWIRRLGGVLVFVYVHASVHSGLFLGKRLLNVFMKPTALELGLGRLMDTRTMSGWNI